MLWVRFKEKLPRLLANSLSSSTPCPFSSLFFHSCRLVWVLLTSILFTAAEAHSPPGAMQPITTGTVAAAAYQGAQKARTTVTLVLTILSWTNGTMTPNSQHTLVTRCIEVITRPKSWITNTKYANALRIRHTQVSAAFRRSFREVSLTTHSSGDRFRYQPAISSPRESNQRSHCRHVYQPYHILIHPAYQGAKDIDEEWHVVDNTTDALKSAWKSAADINEEYQVTTKLAEGLKE